MKLSFRDALKESLLSLGQEYPALVVVTPDLAKSLRIVDFKQTFPERYISVGVSEADMIGVAAGLATTGLIPVAAAFAMFAVEKPFEQIRNAIAYPNLNVKIVATHGGICVGPDGATHQAIEDLALMRALPNFTVLVAADALETRAALKAALEHKGPVYLRLGRDEAEVVYREEKEFIIGKADLLRSGNDVTLVACGPMVAKALQAAEELEKVKVEARVINMHCLKPLDEEVLLQAARDTGCMVTVEDHTRIGGLGGAVAELLVRKHPVPVEQVALDDQFGESGDAEDLFQKYGLTVSHIIAAAEKAMLRKSSQIFMKERR